MHLFFPHSCESPYHPFIHSNTPSNQARTEHFIRQLNLSAKKIIEHVGLYVDPGQSSFRKRMLFICIEISHHAMDAKSRPRQSGHLPDCRMATGPNWSCSRTWKACNQRNCSHRPGSPLAAWRQRSRPWLAFISKRPQQSISTQQLSAALATSVSSSQAKQQPPWRLWVWCC